jgi:hypothetical protein
LVVVLVEVNILPLVWKKTKRKEGAHPAKNIIDMDVRVHFGLLSFGPWTVDE